LLLLICFMAGLLTRLALAVPDLGDQSQAHRDPAHGERHPPVAAVLGRQIDAAGRATRTYPQETAEQRGRAAGGAAAAQACGKG
jgi:hypothetical protein